MSNLVTLIIVGDIIVCGFLAALVAWLFARADKKSLDAAAQIPLLDDDESWNANGFQNPEYNASTPAGGSGGGDKA